MKEKIIRFVCAAVCTALTAASFCGCSEKKAVASTKNYSDMSFKSTDELSGTVYENERFALGWNEEKLQIVLTDKQSGKQYSTMPSEAMETAYDELGMPIRNNALIESPVVAYYYDTATVSETTALAGSESISDGTVYTEKTEKGIRVIYEFATSEISVPVEYTLEDDSLTVSVDPTEISDNGTAYVTGVAIAPFIMGVKNDTENSYFFLPDGSGTVIKPDTYGISGSTGSVRVYGDDLNIQEYYLKAYTKQMNLPIFGMKNGDSAVFGIITSGESQAYINWNIGSKNVKYSSVFPFFRIRGYNMVKAPKGYAASDAEIKVFDSSITETPLSVSYYFLNGDNADYSGMAKTYREYLTDNNLLEKQKNSGSAAFFRLLGGVEKTEYTLGVPQTVLHSLTTVEQAQEIAEYLKKNLKSKILISLEGFGQSGLNIGKVGGGFEISSKLGSKKAIKALSGYCKENGISLFMDFDLIRFSESGSGFSSSETAKLFNGRTLIINTYDNVTRNTTDIQYKLLSRSKLSDAAQKAQTTLTEYEIAGISLSTLSNTAYSDYAFEGAAVSGGMAEQVAGILTDISKENTVLTAEANVYAAIRSDYIADVPTASSGLDISGYDIPFYSMVFKGYIPMSGESVNLASDSKEQLLRCIEAGVAPSYTLAYSYDESIAASDISSLGLCAFDGLKEDMVQTVNEVCGLLSKTENAEIINHTVLENGLRVTEYSNGVRIIVNYTDTDLSYGDITVKAENYAETEG